MAADHSAADQHERKPLVMIVDDQPKNLHILGTILSSIDCDIIAVSKGSDALATLETESPDLILLDVMMPGMDGFKTCHLLKERERSKSIPVIFLTARTETADIVRGFAEGAADFVTKPFNAPELLARVNTQLQMKAARDNLERVAAERSELLHVLAHDLKNPVEGVANALEIIERLPRSLDELLPSMRTALAQAIRLIDVVKSLGALESGKAHLTVEAVSLAHSLRRVETILASQLDAKGIEFEVDGPKQLCVFADEVTFINTVLSNLVTNAVKFSFRGSRVSIRYRPSGESVRIVVSDHGIGMPESILVNLFSVSKPTSRRGTDGELGTGFGMPLVKKFVEAYGGIIEVASREADTYPDSHGTEITLTLRRAP